MQNASIDMENKTEKVVKDIGARASRMASETSEAATDYYEKANTWLQQNYGKALGVIGFLATIGTIAYLIGRNNSRSETELPTQRT